MNPRRVIAYIDGFNLYYGLKNASFQADYQHLQKGGRLSDCLGRSLYWLNIHSVIAAHLARGDTCTAIKYFTAPRKLPKLVSITARERQRMLASNDRQRIFVEAIQTLPLVEVIPGFYAEKNPHTCGKCGHARPSFEEKGTDVNLASQMVCDAFDNRMDLAIVISADSDLAAPIAAVQERGKKILALFAPGRKKAKHLREVVKECRNLTIKSIRGHTMPDVIQRGNGLPPINRPPEWMPGLGWVWEQPKPGELKPRGGWLRRVRKVVGRIILPEISD